MNATFTELGRAEPSSAEPVEGAPSTEVAPLSSRVARGQHHADRFGDLLGASPQMRELFADLTRIANTELSLLVQGETGTGKELVASSLHDESPRATGPFVVFDCSAVAPTLAESELFGHERGAFTGATSARAGVFEQACGGTIFLDEIGELPLALQPKLLRVLEKREVRRLGDSKPRAIDVRVIAATNRNLRAEVKLGNFREDLYYRLAGAQITVPPLRERASDLELLAESFLAREQPPRKLAELSPSCWEMFQAYAWPGNVRELRNALRRALVTPHWVLEADSTTAPTLPASPSAPAPGRPEPLRVARRSAADAFERTYVQQLLRYSGGNVTRAAAVAQVSRQLIHRLMLKHGA